jgi:hypothetical protein
MAKRKHSLNGKAGQQFPKLDRLLGRVERKTMENLVAAAKRAGLPPPYVTRACIDSHDVLQTIRLIRELRDEGDYDGMAEMCMAVGSLCTKIMNQRSAYEARRARTTTPAKARSKKAAKTYSERYPAILQKRNELATANSRGWGLVELRIQTGLAMKCSDDTVENVERWARRNNLEVVSAD